MKMIYLSKKILLTLFLSGISILVAVNYSGYREDTFDSLGNLISKSSLNIYELTSFENITDGKNSLWKYQSYFYGLHKGVMLFSDELPGKGVFQTTFSENLQKKFYSPYVLNLSRFDGISIILKNEKVSTEFLFSKMSDPVVSFAGESEGATRSWGDYLTGGELAIKNISFFKDNIRLNSFSVSAVSMSHQNKRLKTDFLRGTTDEKGFEEIYFKISCPDQAEGVSPFAAFYPDAFTLSPADILDGFPIYRNNGNILIDNDGKTYYKIIQNSPLYITLKLKPGEGAKVSKVIAKMTLAGSYVIQSSFSQFFEIFNAESIAPDVANYNLKEYQTLEEGKKNINVVCSEKTANINTGAEASITLFNFELGGGVSWNIQYSSYPNDIPEPDIDVTPIYHFFVKSKSFELFPKVELMLGGSSFIMNPNYSTIFQYNGNSYFGVDDNDDNDNYTGISSQVNSEQRGAEYSSTLDINNNGIYDTFESFFNYHSTPLFFLSGQDFNNNGYADESEDDVLADFPVKTSLNHYELNLRVDVINRLYLNGGYLYERGLVFSGKNRTTWMNATISNTSSTDFDLYFSGTIKYSKDTLPDDVRDDWYTIDTLRSGKDSLLFKNSVSGDLFLGLNLKPRKYLDGELLTRIKINHQLDTDVSLYDSGLLFRNGLKFTPYDLVELFAEERSIRDNRFISSLKLFSLYTAINSIFGKSFSSTGKSSEDLSYFYFVPSAKIAFQIGKSTKIQYGYEYYLYNETFHREYPYIKESSLIELVSSSKVDNSGPYTFLIGYKITKITELSSKYDSDIYFRISYGI